MDWLRSFLESKGGDEEKQEEEKTAPNLVNGAFPLPGVTHGTSSTTPAQAPPQRPVAEEGGRAGAAAGATPYRFDASRQLHPGGRTSAAARMTPASDDRGRNHGGAYDYPSQQRSGTRSRHETGTSAPRGNDSAAAFAPKPPPPSPAPRAPFYPTPAEARWPGGDSPFLPHRSTDSDAPPAGRGTGASTMGTAQPEAPSADPYRRRYGDPNLEGPHSAGPEVVRQPQYRYRPRTSVSSTAPLMVPKSPPREVLEARQMERSRKLAAASAHWQQQQQQHQPPNPLWHAQQRVASASKSAAKRWNANSRIIPKRCRLQFEGDVVPVVVGGASAEGRRTLLGERGEEEPGANNEGQDRPAKRQRQDPSDEGKKPAAAAAAKHVKPRPVAAGQPTVPANPPQPCRRRRPLGADVTVEIKHSARTVSEPNRVRSIGGVEGMRKQPPVGAERLRKGYTNQPIPSDAVRISKRAGRASASKPAPRPSVASPYPPSAGADLPSSPSELDKKAKRGDAGVSLTKDDPNYPMSGNWGSLFQGLKKFSWKCKVCDVGQEDPKSEKCVSCEAPRYAWKCRSCGEGNEDDKLTLCGLCGASRQDAASALVPQAAASAPPASLFAFGGNAASSTTAPTNLAPSAAPKFAFGVQSATTTATPSRPSFQFPAPSSTIEGAAQAGSNATAPAASTLNGSKIAAVQFGSSTSSASSTAPDGTAPGSTAPAFGFTFAGQMNGSKTEAEKAKETKESATASHSPEATAPAPHPIPRSGPSFGFGQGWNAPPSDTAGSADLPKKRRVLAKDFEDRKREQSKSDTSTSLFGVGPGAPAAPSSHAPLETAPMTLPAAPFGFPSTTSATAMSNISFQANEIRPSDSSITPVPPAPFGFGATSGVDMASAPSFGSKSSDPTTSAVAGAAFGTSGSRKRSSGASENAPSHSIGIAPATEPGNASAANSVFTFGSTPAPAPAPVSNSSENLATVSSFGSTGSELQAGIVQSATFGTPAFGQSTGFGPSTLPAPAPPASGQIPSFGSATATILPSAPAATFQFGSSSSSTTSSSNQHHFGATPASASSDSQFGSLPSAPPFGNSTTPAPAPAVQQFGSTPSGPPFGASPAFGSATSAQPVTQFGFGGQSQQPSTTTGFQPFSSSSASLPQSSITGFAGSTSFGIGAGGSVPAPAPPFGGFGGPSIAAPAPSQSNFGQPLQPTSSFSVGSTTPLGGFGSSGDAPGSFTLGQAPGKAAHMHGRRVVKARRPGPGPGRG